MLMHRENSDGHCTITIYKMVFDIKREMKLVVSSHRRELLRNSVQSCEFRIKR
uniref:SJCHGC07583 protein n=1 Tax=Schistosoma japonicum TaxID=6182 RepID=Q3KTH2_SCHJA|nr:SJCHGC07583 protein [Schistosoma japonicum]